MDIAALVVSGVLIYSFRFDTFSLHERYQWAIQVIAIILILVGVLIDAYGNWRVKRLGRILADQVIIWTMTAVASASIIYFIHAAERYSRLWLALTFVLSFVISALGRVALRTAMGRFRIKGRNRCRVFMIGPGKTLLNVTRHMRREQSAGFSVSGVQRLARTPSPQELESIARRVAASGSQEVWICMPLNMGNAIKAIMHALRHQTVEIRFFPEFSDLPILNHKVSEVVGLYAIDLSVSPMTGQARFTKRLEDLVIGTLIAICISPFCLMIAIAIKCSSRGPILFKQYRTGINGKRFKVYKFRSMKLGASEGSLMQARRHDPRFTRIGAFLRRTSLDELPQFYNVLQGRMSIVGPRPHALSHNEYYKELVESYMQRHKVKPGITGWAQVSGYRGETDTIEKMQKRVQYDLWYLENWSLKLDLKIIFLTAVKGFFGKNVY
ncbi:undecaprenyl-phosphate glucose phosphotransferase [Salinicola halophilus]|uniref:undecaprenyl-phosphate glucose phosphotransferase n=1 Tax=Salinicola halophilus TaxID=184065 RepID=UPI000DA11982|nr:undecaprenyl-phosphate glucose phosphotransferase [Salinicola halophilus]